MKRIFCFIMSIFIFANVNGQETFERTYDFNSVDIGKSVLEIDGGCFIVGKVEDTITHTTDAYISYININTGNIVGDILYGGIYDDTFSDFKLTSDNDCICIGTTEINEDGDSDVYLVKIDEEGIFDVPENFNRVDRFMIYPNPVKDILNINTSKVDLISFTIENISGRSIQNGEFQKSIDVSALTAGVYLLKAGNGNEIITKKFIKID